MEEFKLEGSITLYGKVFGKYVKANITTKDIENLKQERDDLLEALHDVMNTFVNYRDEDLHSNALEVKNKAKQAIEKALK